MPRFNFGRLVRFKNPAGKIYYGEVEGEFFAAEDLIGRNVPVYTGVNPWDNDFHRSYHREPISELPSFNFPIVFTKPPSALAGPLEDIPVPKVLPDIDYEGELCVIIGRDLKDLGEDEDPTPYILGYTVGNDVSSRYWQKAERCGGQHGYAKSFDKFAPIGPILASTSAIPDPKTLTLRTSVNGEQRQKTQTDDLIFDIPAILRYISRGTTLRPGTLIMTGTPSGVGAFMKPPTWLQDGDIVEIEISGIGQIRNKMVIEK